METLTLATLYSGSKGNCTYIKCGEDEILIDAGRSLRALCDGLHALGTDILKISAVFITHEHSDHISALEMLCKKYSIPIHITEGSAKKVLDSTTYVRTNAVLHTPIFSEKIGNLTVSSFPTPHDSDMSVGYTVFLPDGTKIGYATDIGHITDEISENLLGSRAVVIESNHDTEMLKNGSYPSWLKSRILSPRGHLSNEDCDSFLPRLAESGTKYILLAHLSAENNTPDTALCHARAACSDAEILVAREAVPTRLL